MFNADVTRMKVMRSLECCRNIHLASGAPAVREWAAGDTPLALTLGALSRFGVSLRLWLPGSQKQYQSWLNHYLSDGCDGNTWMCK